MISGKKSKSYSLFTPGPVSVRDVVLKKLSEPVLFHRTEPLEKIHRQISNKLLKFFGASSKFVPILITGSGTLANEIVLTSLLRSGDKLLILSNGHFAERLTEIAKLHSLNVKILDFGWAKNINIKRVEEKLKSYKPNFVGLVALETSTGMVNPVKRVGALCKKYGIKFFVDGVSAIGSQDAKVSRDNIDICTSVPNKALEAPPGLSFICIKKNLLLKEKLPEPSGYYMDISRYYTYLEKHQAPTTPAVSLMVGLNKALDLFISETLKNRIKRYKTNSKIVENKAKKLGLKLLLQEKDRANSISTFYLPDSKYAEKLSDHLLKKGLTVWHHDYQKLDKHLQAIMQISVMGDINKQDIDGLFEEVDIFTSNHPLNYQNE